MIMMEQFFQLFPYAVGQFGASFPFGVTAGDATLQTSNFRVSLPFSFPFYGERENTLFVSSTTSVIIISNLFFSRSTRMASFHLEVLSPQQFVKISTSPTLNLSYLHTGQTSVLEESFIEHPLIWVFWNKQGI